MAEIIGVKFKPGGKLYYFKPNDEYLLQGTQVIVETSRGMECGEVAMERRTVPDEQITHELKSVVRAATPEDLKRVEDNRKREKEAFVVCEGKIADHKLDMKLVSVEYAFDGSKIVFNFTADGRVDFRELVKDLASVFHTRIELRQIGVRDEAKMLGGLGICGRPFCCATFLGDFVPVSIKMAKEQNLSLNPVKISGTCGRLMCCLKYEEEAYIDLLKRTPRVGCGVSTPEGNGTIIEVNLLTGKLRVRMEDTPEGAPKTFDKRQVKVISGKQPEIIDDEPYEEPVTEPDPSADFYEIADAAIARQAEERPFRESNNRGRNRQGKSRGGQNRPNNHNNGQQKNADGSQKQGGQKQGGQKQGGGQKQSGQKQANQNGQNRGNNGKNRGGNNQNRPNNQGGQKQGNQNGQNNRPNNQPKQGGGKPGNDNRPNNGGQSGQRQGGGHNNNRNRNRNHNGNGGQKQGGGAPKPSASAGE